MKNPVFINSFCSKKPKKGDFLKKKCDFFEKKGTFQEKIWIFSKKRDFSKIFDTITTKMISLFAKLFIINKQVLKNINFLVGESLKSFKMLKY